MPKYPTPFNHMFNPGHRGCAGCGEMIAIRHVVDNLGPNAILTNATGCSEVVSSQYPNSSWKHPWMHSLFENASATATGIQAALKSKGKSSASSDPSEKIHVVAMGGDGATFDIGTGLISGMMSRKDNILYVCWDNEAYENTGYQASGATPHGASATTSPAGKASFGNPLKKKDMVAFALAHKAVYVATSTAGYPLDIARKVKKALTFDGPKYIQILCPCVPGWGIDPSISIQLGKLGHKTGLYPVVEYENGKLTNVMKIPGEPVKVDEYLKPQKRFKHLFKREGGEAEIAEIQAIADENLKKYNLA